MIAPDYCLNRSHKEKPRNGFVKVLYEYFLTVFIIPTRKVTCYLVNSSFIKHKTIKI